MAELRPSTNLVVPEHLKLDPKKLKDEFLYVYNKGYTGLEIVFMTKLWCSTLFPSIANDPAFGQDRKGVKAAFATLEKNLPNGYLAIKKVMEGKPYFVISVPVFKFSRQSSMSMVEFLRSWMLGNAILRKGEDKPPTDPAPETMQENDDIRDKLIGEGDAPKNVVYPGAKVIANMKNLDSNARQQLESTLLSLRVVTKGELALVYLDFKMSAEIAQQLTSTPMIELRTVDLYPLLLAWCNNGWGYKEKPPVASFPISSIAASVPAGLGSTDNARINEDNLSVAPNGKPFFIPRELNNTQKYEDMYIQAGSRADNTFSLLDVHEGAQAMELGQDEKLKLPRNIPVFIDWLNAKYAYTDTNGMMQVRELARYRKANATHIVNMMHRFPVESKFIGSWSSLGSVGGVTSAAFKAIESDYVLPDGEQLFANERRELEAASTPEGWTSRALQTYVRLYNEVPDLTKIAANAEFALFRPIARYLKLVDKAVMANLDAVYERYSVRYVAETYPWVIMVARYGDKMADMEAQSATLRSAAINQGIDPDWTPPSIPLASKTGIAFLPHQQKVRNLLRNSPDFAILPVQAGGGKSVLAITDVLYEIKANRNQPYLIMCPGHLVANYIKEIVFFTDGKLNAIAINSFTVMSNGWKRIEEMLKAAPRNTVVVADYDGLVYRAETLCYGTTPVKVYPVIEFLRQFHFGYCLLDESQKVKNKSLRTDATMSLIVDIPKKRLASGTMVHDSMQDLAMQMAMMDPTIFGTTKEFRETFGAKLSGDRVIEWKDGYENMIDDKIKSNVVVAGAMRKEWAALLPPKDERILGVTLSDEQMRVYNLIFKEQIDQLREAAKGNKALLKFLSDDPEDEEDKKLGPDGEPADDEEEDDDRPEDEDGGEAVANALRPYLARIEQFTGAPGSDALGKELLHGEDLISPKLAKCHERIRAHLFGGKDNKGEAYGPFKGKVLVFTSYDATAKAIFESAPDDLKKCGLLYDATTKMEDGDRFASDDTVKWMVGISTSMEEGLNFQFCSRLIRMEGIWNPGQLEQGNSRINRPELKKAEDERDMIFYDWIVANKTVDITKLARLISKTIIVGKFENRDNPEFGDLEALPLIKMKLKEILKNNDFYDTLEPYNLAYRQYRKIRDDEYTAYKTEYRETHNGQDPKLIFAPTAPNPPDCALLKRVPYTPGMGIYGEEQEGLVRIDLYLKSKKLQEDFDKAGIEKDPVGDPSGNKALLQLMKGRRIHTQYGDGYCRSINTLGMQDVIVDLDQGYSVRAKWSTAFMLTRTETSPRDIRDGLLKQSGELPIVTPIEVPADAFVKDSKTVRIQLKREQEIKEQEQKKRAKEQKQALSLELQFTIINGFLGVLYVPTNETASKALQALGFRPSPKYYFAQMKNAKMLLNQFNLWREKGFSVDPSTRKVGVSDAIEGMYDLLKSRALSNHKDTIKWASNSQVRNFYRLEQKASPDKKMIKPYPVIQDEVAYIVLPIAGQPASKNAIKYKAPGVVWHVSGDEMTYFGLTPQHMIDMMKQIQAVGIDVTNIMELRKEFLTLKKIKTRQGKANPDADAVLSSLDSSF